MRYTDSQEMKIEFIYELLLSIRGDFGEESALRERKDLALKLTKLAIKEFNRRARWMEEYVDEKRAERLWGTTEFNRNAAKKLIILEKTIKKFVPFKTDGRYFRYDFPYGYIGMLEYFGLESNDEKKLKALDIIKNKNVDVKEFKHRTFEKNGFYYYNLYRGNNALTIEEIDLLKEVLL